MWALRGVLTIPWEQIDAQSTSFSLAYWEIPSLRGPRPCVRPRTYRYTTSVCLRSWANVVQMLYKCFALTGKCRGMCRAHLLLWRQARILMANKHKMLIRCSAGADVQTGVVGRPRLSEPRSHANTSSVPQNTIFLTKDPALVWPDCHVTPIFCYCPRSENVLRSLLRYAIAHRINIVVLYFYSKGYPFCILGSLVILVYTFHKGIFSQYTILPKARRMQKLDN